MWTTFFLCAPIRFQVQRFISLKICFQFVKIVFLCAAYKNIKMTLKKSDHMFFSVRLCVFKMQGFNSLKNFSFYLSKWCFCAPRINEQKELVVLIFLSSDILMFLYAAHRNREKITYYPNFLFWGTCLHVYLFTCL